MEDNVSSTASFYSSDVFITDWSGVAYEYAFGTEKPILFLDVPQKIVNQSYKEIQIEIDRLSSPLNAHLNNLIIQEEIDILSSPLNAELNQLKIEKNIEICKNYTFEEGSQLFGECILRLIENESILRLIENEIN